MKNLILLAATVAVFAAPADARPPRSGAYKLSDVEAKAAMRDYVDCSIKAAPALASQAVVEDWEGKKLIGDGSKLVSSECTRAAGFIAQMRFQPEIFRAVMAERLLTRDPSIVVTRDQVSALAPLAYHQPWPVKTVDDKGKALGEEAIAKQQAGYNRRLGAIAGQQVAECVIKADPTRVRPLFANKVDSEDELAALKGLSGALPGCVPANKKFSFDRQSLRGSLALAYYRLAMAAKGVTWAGEPAEADGAQD